MSADVPKRARTSAVAACAGLFGIGRNRGSGGSRRFAEVCDLRFRKLPLVRTFSAIPITPVSVKKRKQISYGNSVTTAHFDDTTELAHKYLIIGTGSVTNCQYWHMWSYQWLQAVPKTAHQPYNIQYQYCTCRARTPDGVVYQFKNCYSCSFE